MATQKHVCGHESEIPTHMGRGAARQVRLFTYYNKPCLDCRRAAAAAEAAKMWVLLPGTGPDGKRSHRLYNADEIAAYVARHVR
jgi:hypothetical protein